MTRKISEEAEKYLKRAFERLRDRISVGRKKVPESVLGQLLGIKSNDRLRIFQDCSLSSESVPLDVLKHLQDGGFIKRTASASVFALTAQGIIAMERLEGGDPVARLLNSIDERIFGDIISTQGSPLSSRERIIVLMMIMLRAYSESAGLSLGRSEACRDSIRKSILKAHEVLAAAGVFRAQSEAEIFGRVRTEHPVSNLLRHTDKLPKKTGGVYLASRRREQCYYLDLCQEGVIAVEKMGLLLWQIYGAKLDADRFEALSNSSKQVISEEGINVFENLAESFAGARHDGLLRDAYDCYLANSAIWGRPTQADS